MRPADLRIIPLFQRMTDAHLQELVSVFERHELKAGTVLFRAGEEPKHFHILGRGEVSLLEGTVERFRLQAVAPIGELGAMTSVPHNVTALAFDDCEVLRVEIPTLMEFFERRGDVAFPYYHNLLTVVSDKVRSDERRLTEMRANVIRTQKEMKRLREVVLSREETPISDEVARTLDALIEQNKRGHYLVEPKHSLSSKVRLDDGTTVAVKAISDEHLQIAKAIAAKGAAVSFVLITPNAEIPLSGTVESADEGSVIVELDLRVDEYEGVLREYLTRVQMLDFVV